MKNTNTTVKSTSYHHGDLRNSLLETASQTIREKGIDSLSLRKLAESVGVSRTALYHHFKNKNDLLCALAEEGFREFHRSTDLVFQDKSHSMTQSCRRFVHHYVHFATQNPELYELMFGRTIWKQEISTDELRSAAHLCFDKQVELVKMWQQHGLFQDLNSVRLTQILWSSLHGIARMFIDGIYIDTRNIDDICDSTATLFMQQVENESNK